MDRRLDCIIKIGGAALTKKEEESTLNEEVLDQVIEMIVQLYKQGLKFILIHGAGSFGHIQAKRNPVHTGGIGVGLVRAAVIKLSQIITEKLSSKEVNAVMTSPFPVWETKNNEVISHNSKTIETLVFSGLVPVIHGDVVVDTENKFSILSGDVIGRVLAEELKPRYFVFLSDIQEGIFTLPPQLENSTLVKEILVHKDGTFEMPETFVNTDCDVTGDDCVIQYFEQRVKWFFSSRP